jgi:hypothetical protein
MALLIITAAAAIALLVAMYVRDKPFYGVLSIGLLSGPGTILSFVHLTVA